jgi:hypothetical protein
MNSKKDNIRGDVVKKINGKFESQYFYESEIVKKELDSVSPSFCLAKWYNVSLHIPTGKTHSCYHPKAHQIPLEEIKIDVSALHNTKYKKEQRKMMLEGKRPDECNFCWQIEDSGNHLSDRAYRSKDVYEEGIIDKTLEINYLGNVNPKYLEVNFNQACNFKCIYCSPHLSTEWQKDIEKHGSYILKDRHHNDLSWVKQLNIDNSSDNPYLIAFWKWFPNIYKDLNTFRMTGGEPLMDKNTFKIFDYIIDNPKKDLQLSITSNCCPPKDQWQKFINYLVEIENNIDHFMLFCSLDSWGNQAEYIRNGLDFQKLINNLEIYLINGKSHSLTFIITFNVLSYTGIFSYIQNILELRKKFNTSRQLIWFDIPHLIDPDFLNPKLIPELISELTKAIKFMENNKEEFSNRFKGFKDFEIDKLKRLVNWINSDTYFNRELAEENFYLFIKENDRRRNISFINYFPELKNFYIECDKKYGSSNN